MMALPHGVSRGSNAGAHHLDSSTPTMMVTLGVTIISIFVSLGDYFSALRGHDRHHQHSQRASRAAQRISRAAHRNQRKQYQRRGTSAHNR